MKTPEQIATQVSAEFYEFGEPEEGIRSGYLETGVVGRMIVAAIEADRAERAENPAQAKAGDWEVTSEADEDARWVYLETFDPDAEAASGEDEQITASMLTMSDVEALVLYRALGEAIETVSPNLLALEGALQQ